MSALLDRRAFISRAGAGIVIATTLGPWSRTAAQAQRLDVNLWIGIGLDGSISIFSPAAELGQGSFTTLPLVVAEELDADWSKVRVIQPPVFDAKKYGNPERGGTMSTTSSFAVRGYYKSMRVAGGQARRVLLEAAASRLGVPLDELTTEPSVVLHTKSGRRLSYGEIAAFARVPEKLPEIADGDLKPAARFRLIGKDVSRVDLPLKVSGAAKYAIDAQVPGMVYASMRQPPAYGGTPSAVNDTAALKVPGVMQVVRLPNGVAVIGTSVEATQAAARLLEITWSNDATAAYDSDRIYDTYAQIAQDLGRTGVDFHKSGGDVAAALKAAKKVIRTEYRTPHVYHAQMEPLNATVSIAADGKSAELWAGTQDTSGLIDEIARLMRIDRANIVLHQHFLGGGFGRRSQHEVVVDAARLAQAVGKPVKLIWSREDDLTQGKFRPLTLQQIDVGVDEMGLIVAWRHRIVAESVLAFMFAPYGRTPPRNDHIIMKGSPIPMYGIPNKLAEHLVEAQGTRITALRGVGNAPNAFAIESTLDEVALATGKDPLTVRLELCASAPRMLTLLREVAEMSEWRRPRQGRALGIAAIEKDDTLAAGVAEISVDAATGKIKVHNFWAAIDAGTAVQPGNLEAQTEGSIVFGLGHVLRERIAIKNGRVQQSNFHDYEVARMSDVPAIRVKVVSTPNRPTGGGEAGVPLVAPAVGNALFALTRKRIRELPFLPDRVAAALKA